MSNGSVKRISMTVEEVIDKLLDGTIPVKSLVVINDVAGGEIFGVSPDDTYHHLELAQGVSYLVLGVGNMPTSYLPGVNFVDWPKVV